MEEFDKRLIKKVKIANYLNLYKTHNRFIIFIMELNV